MADQLQLRGGTTAEHSTFTGALREVTVDTDKDTLVVHDNATVGGRPLMREDGSNSALSLGSASAPSIKFTGDPNTGIYSPGADQVAISTNGSGRLFVNSTGQVGMGGQPAHPAHIYSSGTGTYFKLTATDATGNGDRTITIAADRPGVAYHNLAFSAESYQFGVSGTERMRLTSTGLGIGTTAPAGPLQVSNASDAVVDITNTGTGLSRTRYQTSTRYFQVGINDGAGSGFAGAGAYSAVLWNVSNTPLVFATDNTQRAQIDASGRLLMGTSSARTWAGLSHSLQIETTDYTRSGVIQINNGNDSIGALMTLGKTRSASNGGNTAVQNGDLLGRIYFVGADGTGLVQGATIEAIVDGTPGTNDLPTRLTFSTSPDGASSPTERMRIDQLGYLRASNSGSYNDTTASYHEFSSSAGTWTTYFRNTNAAPYGVRINYNTDSNGTANEFLYCVGNATLRASIRSNGGLANFSANNANLSDRNAKKDITPAADTWDCVKEWEIVNYRYKDQPDDADLNLGVIAQQVAESCPEVITVFQEAKEAKPAVFDEEGNEIEPAQEAQPEKLGVKEQQMYWMAIKALQEAQNRIETLEAKVAALEGS